MMRFDPMPAPAIDGRPLVDGVWGAMAGHWSFVISYIKDYGYAASWKNMEFEGAQSANEIDGTPFQKFTEAERACKAVAKQLRSPA